MSAFDAILVVDWSAANDRGETPVNNAVWSALWQPAGVEEPLYHRNRETAEAYLGDLIAAETAAGRRLLIGFDFPFGYPKGFAAKVTGSPDPLALWDWYAANLEDTPTSNSRFALAGGLNAMFLGIGPFWFNGLADDIADLPRRGTERVGHGMPERRAVEEIERGAFSVWQMGGAGSVGGQVMTGVAALSRLRARFPDDVAVWPFEAPDRAVVFAEVWPSLLNDQVHAETGENDIRDAVQVSVLARALGGLNGAGLDSLLADTGPEATEEGWILGAGKADVLALGASAPLLPKGTDWLPVDDALARIRDAIVPAGGRETVAAAQSGGRVLANPVTAARSNPPGANSAVDGYGVAAATIGAPPCTLPITPGRAAAGAPFAGSVPPGTALRILTGALLPEGVDTVLLDEEVSVEGDTLRRSKPVKPGANTRAAGEDVTAGAALFEVGHRVTPADLAIMAATGVTAVSVARPLRVGVLSTGLELVAPDPAAPPSQTFDANRSMLMEVLRRWGYEPVDLGIVADSRDALRDRLTEAAKDCDAVLTSGGASAGDEDHVSALLTTEGDPIAARVAIKPGRPLAVAHWQGTPVFALPGNPVAAFVCALIFARPALGRLAGEPWRAPQAFDVPAGFTKSKRPGRREYLRARIGADGRVETFSSEGSGRISGLSWADGLVELPDCALRIEPGVPVRYLPFSSFGL